MTVLLLIFGTDRPSSQYSVVLIIVFLGSSVPYWNRILAYTRGEYQAQRPHTEK